MRSTGAAVDVGLQWLIVGRRPVNFVVRRLDRAADDRWFVDTRSMDRLLHGDCLLGWLVFCSLTRPWLMLVRTIDVTSTPRIKSFDMVGKCVR
jgi:hypothetical protein